MKNYLVKRLDNPEARLKGFIVIHKKHKNYPSLGATRFFNYSSPKKALKDAENLARLMSYKSAISGLPYGGAKGVIVAPKKFSPKEKEKILDAYVEELNRLRGAFVTGSDMGLEMRDIKRLKKKTKFVIGLKVSPEYYTALGVILSLKTAVKQILGQNNLRGKTFCIQGLGKTGLSILKLLSNEKGIQILVSDTDKTAVKNAKKIFPKIQAVLPKNLFNRACDVFMPCAVGGILSPKNIRRLKAKIVVGSANNQLSDAKSAFLLQKRGIFYAPDYLVNSGGLISVSEELKSSNPSKKVIMNKLVKIPKKLQEIIIRSKKTGLPPGVVADKMAEKIFNRY